MAYAFTITRSADQYTVEFGGEGKQIFTSAPCASESDAKSLIETIRMQAPMAAVETSNAT